MITKFDSLFAGHVDLDNVGYAGTPINDRRYDNAHLSTALQGAGHGAARWMAWLQHILDGRAPLPARRDGVHPERAADGAAPDAFTRT